MVSVHYGQPMQWSAPVTTNVYFNEFESLESTKNCSVESPEFQCHGHPWIIELYPGGCELSKDGFTGCFLKFRGEGMGLRTRYSLYIPAIGKTFTERDHMVTSAGFGWADVYARNSLLSNTVDDSSLQIDVTIQVRVPKTTFAISSTPRQLQADMSRLLFSKERADVMFNFTDGVTVPAHSVILFARAPLLAELVEKERASSDGTTCTDVYIAHVSSDAFKAFLRFVYSADLAHTEKMENPKDVLEIANRFGLIELKLIMESDLINKHLKRDSAIDLLIFADSCCCAWLREEATTVTVRHIQKLRKTKEWGLLQISADLMSEVCDRCISNPYFAYDDELANLSVCQIYQELYALGAMPIDGTRKMLVQKLLALRARDENHNEETNVDNGTDQ